MRIFEKKYSASESESKLADAIVYAMAKNQLKSYVRVAKFCNKFSSTSTGKNPLFIKFGKIQLTEDIIKLLKIWKVCNYKCTNKRLQKGIDLLYDQLLA